MYVVFTFLSSRPTHGGGEQGADSLRRVYDRNPLQNTGRIPSFSTPAQALPQLPTETFLSSISCRVSVGLATALRSILIRESRAFSVIRAISFERRRSDPKSDRPQTVHPKLLSPVTRCEQSMLTHRRIDSRGKVADAFHEDFVQIVVAK